MKDQVRVSARGLVVLDGRLLVVRYKDERGEWYVVPGGGQRHGETLIDTVKREVFEETGHLVSVGPLRFVRELIGATCDHSKLADLHGVEIFFECQLDPAGAAAECGHEPDEDQTGIEWIEIERLADLRFFPESLLPHLPRNGGRWGKRGEGKESGEAIVYLGAKG